MPRQGSVVDRQKRPVPSVREVRRILAAYRRNEIAARPRPGRAALARERRRDRS